MAVGWEPGIVGVGERKKTELPDLNKVNFLAIWPVFRKEGEALKAGRAGVRQLYLKKLLAHNFPKLLKYYFRKILADTSSR